MRGYLDLKGLSEYSSYSVSAIKKWLSHPNYPLPSYRIDGKILVKVEEFEKWMENFKRINIENIDIDAVVLEVCSEVLGGYNGR